MFASLTPAERAKALRAAAQASRLSPDVLRAVLLSDWRIVGRPKQQPPPGEWTYWWVRAGRGFGKTLTAAQWARNVVLKQDPGCRFKLVAPTQSDVRATMVEGETGLLNVLPAEALRGQSRETAWNSSKLELHLANDTLFQGYSSERPDRMRGPQHGYAWCEEVSSWKDANKKATEADTTWSNVQFSTRLGVHPRFCLTSTPKANRLTRALMELEDLVLVTGSSYENRDNLSEAWWRTVIAPHEGTRTGLQEIEGHILEDIEGALWSMALIEERRADEPADLAHLVVAVDPNTTSGETADDAGIVVVAADNLDKATERNAFVLADRTVTSGGPRAWAQAAVDAYHEYEADLIVAEKNQGGEMVEITIHTVDANVPVRLVNASRGKRTRAEPVASLYAGSETVPGRVWHCGIFTELEEEMTTWDGTGESPNRMDALVWGVTHLLLGTGEVGKARVSSPVRHRIDTGGPVSVPGFGSG